MRRIHKVLLSTAAAGHLAMVVAGGLDVSTWEWGAFGRALTYYGAVTGVDSGYSFFAPSVRSAPHAVFTIKDGEGRQTVDSLQDGVTREVDLRVQDLLDVMNDRRADEAVRGRIAASWAAVMFARHPAAESVVVDFGYDRVPPMAALQAGATPGWRSLYKARVVKSGGARR